MNKLEKLRRRKADYERELERIRGDHDYNEGAKARRIAPIYSRLKAEERRILDELKAETAQAAASKGRKAFEAPAMHGADKALVQMNYRHALDSVEGLTEPKDLDARLERAILTGDTTLARAVAYRANEAAIPPQLPSIWTTTRTRARRGRSGPTLTRSCRGSSPTVRRSPSGTPKLRGPARCAPPRLGRSWRQRGGAMQRKPSSACPVCGHQERPLIDRALVEYGHAPRSIIRRYRGLSQRALQRHRDECLAAVGRRG